MKVVDREIYLDGQQPAPAKTIEHQEDVREQ